jgi:hypothetical protein
MADVQTEPAPHMQAAATKVPIAIWVLIGLLALVMAVTTGLAVATLIDDSTPAPQQVKVPVPVAVDVAAAKAMKDESPAAIAVGRATTDAVAASETKADAANHALAVRSLGLQRMLETTDLRQRLEAADTASGTAAKDEAGVAAAVGTP